MIPKEIEYNLHYDELWKCLLLSRVITFRIYVYRFLLNKIKVFHVEDPLKRTEHFLWLDNNLIKFLLARVFKGFNTI